jgi:SAM-dependent methyltransferase
MHVRRKIGRAKRPRAFPKLSPTTVRGLSFFAKLSRGLHKSDRLDSISHKSCLKKTMCFYLQKEQLMDTPQFTPALGYRWLTPLYDSAIVLLTREKVWREALLRQVDPKPGDVILDVGCGTGSFVTLLKQAQAAATVIGADPDGDVLAITFLQGFLSEDLLKDQPTPTKIVSSLVFHQVQLPEKRRLLKLIRGLLPPHGELHIADYGLQRTKAMRMCFRLTVQLLDGVRDTQPNADGVLPEIMKEVGFTTVEELRVIPTVTGSISLYRAKP